MIDSGGNNQTTSGNEPQIAISMGAAMRSRNSTHSAYDHLAFTANFQPTIVPHVMAGKLAGGVFALWLATKLSVPRIGLVSGEKAGNVGARSAEQGKAGGMKSKKGKGKKRG